MSMRSREELIAALEEHGELRLRFRPLVPLVACLVFVGASAWLLTIGEASATLVAVLGIAVFGGLALLAVARWRAGTELTVTRDGIRVGAGDHIPWRALRGWHGSFALGAVVIRVHDRHHAATMAALPTIWRVLARINALGFVGRDEIVLPSNLDAAPVDVSVVMRIAAGRD